MTETKPKTKMTEEQKFAALLAKQKVLAAKIEKAKSDMQKKSQVLVQNNRLRVAKLAEAAGLLDLSDSVLKNAFENIAKAQTAQAPVSASRPTLTLGGALANSATN